MKPRDWAVASLAVAALLAGIFAAALILESSSTSNANQIAANQHAACLAGGYRTVQQLKIDWAIYHADAQSAREAGLEPAQRQIRLAEAAAIKAGMVAQAGDRVSIRWASLLQKPLAVVVRKTGFRCPPA